MRKFESTSMLQKTCSLLSFPNNQCSCVDLLETQNRTLKVICASSIFFVCCTWPNYSSRHSNSHPSSKFERSDIAVHHVRHTGRQDKVKWNTHAGFLDGQRAVRVKGQSHLLQVLGCRLAVVPGVPNERTSTKTQNVQHYLKEWNLHVTRNSKAHKTIILIENVKTS